jgi:hypothetical protein
MQEGAEGIRKTHRDVEGEYTSTGRSVGDSTLSNMTEKQGGACGSTTYRRGTWFLFRLMLMEVVVVMAVCVSVALAFAFGKKPVDSTHRDCCLQERRKLCSQ